jgi:hypothetical protein
MAFKSGMTNSAVRSDTYAYDCGQAPVLGPDTMAATSSSPRNVAYTLDQAGNRTSVVDTGITKTYSPNNLNQYSSVGSASVTNGSVHEVASYQGVNYTYINDEI